MTFPATPILDTFNRADENPAAGWTAYTGKNNVAVVSNVAKYGTSTPAAAFFESTVADCEVFATVAAFSSGNNSVQLYARSNAAMNEGYGLQFWGAGVIVLIELGAGTWLDNWNVGTPNVGDSFSLRCVGNSISAWYKAVGGSWTALGTVANTLWPAPGRIGIGFSDNMGKLDNFGGGAFPSGAQLFLNACVDWDNDGIFEGNEKARLRSITITRGRDGLLSAEEFARMKVGECHVTLDNHDRRFDPWYSLSPLYPNVVPGRDFWLMLTDSTPAGYSLFTGRIDDIDSVRQLSDPTAMLVAVDGWRLLSDRRSTIALQTDATTDDLLDAVLTDVGWPAAWGRSLDVGSDMIPYAWVNDQAAYDAIHDMIESEMGYVYVGADGKIYFQSRAAVMLAASAFTLDQSQVAAENVISNPWEFVKNKVSVKAFPRKLGSSTEIWRLEEIRIVQPGQAVTIWGTFRDSNYVSTIAQDVVNPVATTDYTMNTLANGTGTDLTGSFTVTPSIFAGSVKLVVTNNSAFTGYITLLKIRGKPLELLSVSASISENASSQTTYGKRELSLELIYQQQTAVAVNFSDWLVSWLASPLPTLVVEIKDRPSLQFGYDLGTVITFTSSYLGLNHRFRIGKIVHDGEAPFQVWRTRWTLEPVDQVTDYWQLGVTGHDELGVNTRLAY